MEEINGVKKSLNTIKDELSVLTIDEFPKFLEKYKNDERIGVQKLILQCKRYIEKYDNELKRIDGISKYEQELYSMGKNCIAGIDEVGRGPLAGPVMTCALILPKDCLIIDVNDSKKLSETKREELYIKIKEKAIDISIGIVNADIIDNINILQATYKAMQQSINNLNIKPDVVLIDAMTIPNIDIEQISIIRGDAKSITIGAASIIAKVKRDHIMKKFHEIYPQYGFDKNKGYGTKEHIQAIQKYGICPIHRRTFVKHFLYNLQLQLPIDDVNSTV